MLTSSVLVAVLWLKSPDPSGQLPHRHILAISPLQRRFKYQICQEFDFQSLQFNVVHEVQENTAPLNLPICAHFALFCKRLIFPVWLV